MKKNITPLITFFALCVFVVQFIGCGPSKMELEAHAKQGMVYNYETHQFVKDAPNPYEEHTEEEPQPPTSSEEIGYDDIEIRVIDSCEYILWNDKQHSVGNLVHKANCRNPIHKTNQ